MKTKSGLLMVLALLVVLLATSVTRADGPVAGGIFDVGGWNACALTRSGAVDCWGNNVNGQSEDQPGPYTQVDTGGFHTCALTQGGAADCWGASNPWADAGQAEDQPGPYTQVRTGWWHTCALTPSGAVDCWGANNVYHDYGQAVDLPGPYIQLGVGYAHSCGLKADGSVECWGWDFSGQAGYHVGPYTQVSAGYAHTCALTPDGMANCWGAIWYDYGQAADQPGPYTQVSAGDRHTCAVTPSGAVDCWGSNQYGQADDQPGPYTQVSAGVDHTCALTPSGAVDCWGSYEYGQAEDQPGPYGPYVPVGDTTPPVVAVIGVSDGAVYTLGAVPEAGCSTTDADLGVATEATLSLSGGTALGVGSFAATCSGAVDNAGNQAEPVSVSYTVTFQFTGFSAPVDNPDVLNIAKAGQTVPLRWPIADAAGNPVTDLAEVSVTVVALACEQGENPDPVEEYAGGESGLQNLGDGYYQWNWKTPKGYAGLCKTLKLDLGEGAGYEHLALFSSGRDGETQSGGN